MVTSIGKVKLCSITSQSQIRLNFSHGKSVIPTGTCWLIWESVTCSLSKVSIAKAVHFCILVLTRPGTEGLDVSPWEEFNQHFHKYNKYLFIAIYYSWHFMMWLINVVNICKIGSNTVLWSTLVKITGNLATIVMEFTSQVKKQTWWQIWKYQKWDHKLCEKLRYHCINYKPVGQ